MSATAFRFGGAGDDGVRRLSVNATDDPRDAAGGVSLRLARTAAGDDENSHATQALSDVTRKLLSRLDGSLSIDQCLAAVPQARLSDAMLLLPAGLVRTVSCMATSSRTPNDIELGPLVEAVFRLSSEDLYRVLTNQAKLRLGLIHGFRVVLALERCEGQHEQRALALRFIDDIWRTNGERGIRQLRHYLKA